MSRPVPDYGVQRVPPPLRKQLLQLVAVLLLAAGFLAVIGYISFQPVPPPAAAPTAAPAAGGPSPVTRPSQSP